MPMNREWRFNSIGDTSAGNDKDLIAGDSSLEYWVQSIRIEVTASDSMGDRVPVVQIQDADTVVISEFRPLTATAASESRFYEFAPGITVSTEIVDTDWIPGNIPEHFVVPAAHQLRIFDENDVDASSDTFDVRVKLGVRHV